jgi:predicted PurR-regulated permease PerM
MKPDRPVPAAPAPYDDSRRSLRVIALCLSFIAVIVLVAALQRAEAFAVPTVLSGLLALALAPLAQGAERLGLPRRPTAFLLVLGSVIAVMAAVYLVSPSFDAMQRHGPEMIRELERTLTEIEDEVNESVSTEEEAEGADAAISAAEPPSEEADDAEAEARPGLFSSGRQYVTDQLIEAPLLAGSFIYAVFLAFFLLAERRSVARTLLSLLRGYPARLNIARAMRDVRRMVTTYLLAISLINVVLGMATAAVFYALEMPRPLVWGAMMTLLNFMPYLGPILMNAIVIAYGVTFLPSPEDVAAPVAALIFLNTIEGYVLTPSIVGRQVRVGPLAVFFAVAFGAWLWGAAGALIATPALIVLRAFVNRTLVLRRRRDRVQAASRSPA